MIIHEFWQHSRSGDVHSVTLDNSPTIPVVIAASEAIYTPDLLSFRRDPDFYETLPINAEWFNRHSDDYNLYIPVFGS